MTTSSSPPPSLLGAAQQFGRSVLGLVQSRIALFGVELQEEKLRAMRLLTWLGLACALVAAGVLVLVAALALFAWTWAGYAGLCLLAGLCLGLGAGIAWAVRRSIQQGPIPFASTAEEFRRDLECLRRE